MAGVNGVRRLAVFAIFVASVTATASIAADPDLLPISIAIAVNAIPPLTAGALLVCGSGCSGSQPEED